MLAFASARLGPATIARAATLVGRPVAPAVAAAALRLLSVSPPVRSARPKTPLQNIPPEDEILLDPTAHAVISAHLAEPADLHPAVHLPTASSSSPLHITEAQEARRKALPSNTKKLNLLLGSRKPFELKEADLEETFVRGSGPGGQVINKSSISVSLVHKPTGLRVQCHETRSQEQNRKIARKLLAEKLATLDPTSSQPSRSEILHAKAVLKKRRQLKKARRKYKADSEAESEGELERIADTLEDGLPLDGRSEALFAEEADTADRLQVEVNETRSPSANRPA